MIVVPTSVSCGLSTWESPAANYVDLKLSLDDVLIERPNSTFLARAKGDSMRGHGIFDGDLLVIDRHPVPDDLDVVVVSLNGALLCKQIDMKQHLLLSTSESSPPIYVSPDDAFAIEGVVIRSVRLFKNPSVMI